MDVSNEKKSNDSCSPHFSLNCRMEPYTTPWDKPFSGDGEHFGAGVNTTVGFSFKYLTLVIRSKPPREMTNIKYELKGRFGLKSSGVVSLD